MTNHAANDAASRRIDLYLSGGGYRAALGALGVMYFLALESRWQEVGRIVSVSGGSIVNAHLALTRPDADNVMTELTHLFRTLTSRRESLKALAPALALLLVVPLAAVAVSIWVLNDSVSTIGLVAANLLVALAWIVIALRHAIRLWLWRLYHGVVGAAYLDELADADWHTEHVFVATDLSGHGSVFFVVNPIQPQVASVTRGYFDGRDVRFRKVLRATTALPPILPPTRLKLRSTPERPTSPLGQREYLWDPETKWLEPRESIGSTVKIWLADGGVTGNLGIQLDSRLAPDNVALLEFTMSKTMRGAIHNKYMCRRHPHQIAWHCYECQNETIVVDASGTTKAAPRWLERTLGVPVVGVPYFTVRSLQVMYGSSLADDQGLAGDQLIGVVSTDQMRKRIARKNWPLSDSNNAAERMMKAGEHLESSLSLTAQWVRQLRMSRLMQACYAARMASSELKTRLSAVSAPVAARVVASGYLNACLNAHGPGALDTADEGIRRLAELLGPDAALEWWWDGVRSDMERTADSEATGSEARLAEQV